MGEPLAEWKCQFEEPLRPLYSFASYGASRTPTGQATKSNHTMFVRVLSRPFLCSMRHAHERWRVGNRARSARYFLTFLAMTETNHKLRFRGRGCGLFAISPFNLFALPYLSSGILFPGMPLIVASFSF